MDIASIPKETFVALGRFCRDQFAVWLRVVKSPVTEISRLDLENQNSSLDAIRFAVFSYLLSFAVSLPASVIYWHQNLKDPIMLLADAFITALVFVLAGSLLYLSGKAVAGHGKFGACLIAGLYLTAFYPIVYLIDYFGVVSPWMRELALKKMIVAEMPAPTGLDRIYVVIATLASLALYVYLLLKVLPVIKYLHSVGLFRALVAAGIWALLFSFIYAFYIGPLITGTLGTK
jgi:hypothetical protein